MYLHATIPTASSRTHVVPDPRTGSRNYSVRSRGGIARREPSNRSLPNQTSACSHDPGTEFAVHPPSRPRFAVQAEDIGLDEIRSNDEGQSKVSGTTDLAENFQGMDLDESVDRPALSLDTEALTNNLHNMNLDGSYKSPCWSPELYTPSVGIPDHSSHYSTHSRVASTTGGVPLGGNFINHDFYDATFSQAPLSCGTPVAYPADGGFHFEYHVHPSTAFHLPPMMLPFPSANVFPFPSAVLPFPIGLSPLPPTSNADELVFDSEDEARIMETSLRGIL